MKCATDLKVMVIVFGRNYSISWLNSSCCRHCTVFAFFCQVMCRSLLGLSLIPSNRGYLNLLALFQVTVSRCFLCDTHLIRQNMYQKWKKNGFKRLLVKPDMSIQCIKLLPSPGGLAVALPKTANCFELIIEMLHTSNNQIFFTMPSLQLLQILS